MQSEMIRFSCPNCKKAHQAPVAWAGKIAKCDGCQMKLKVPEPALAAAPGQKALPTRLSTSAPAEDRSHSFTDTVRIPTAGRKTTPQAAPAIPVTPQRTAEVLPAVAPVSAAPAPNVRNYRLIAGIAAGIFGGVIFTLLLGFVAFKWATSPSTKTVEVKDPFSGQPLARSEVYEDNEGNIKKHGEEVEWYENGQKGVETSFDRGKKQGEYTEWHPNGQKKLEGTYDNDVRHGIWKLWDDQGQLLRQESYDHDVPHGHWIIIESDGRKAEIQYVNGHKNGPTTTWRADGSKEAAGDLKDDLQSGQWQLWHPNGQLAAQGEYLEGEEEGSWTYWHDNGQKETTCEYRQGKVVGIWPSWDREGHKSPFLKKLELPLLGKNFLGQEVYPSIRSVCFSADGRILAAGTEEKTVLLWEMQNGEQVSTIPAVGEIVNGVTFKGPEQLLAICNGNNVLLWDIVSQQKVSLLSPLNSDGNGCYYPCSSPDGSLIVAAHSDSGNWERYITIWGENSNTGIIHERDNGRSNIQSLAIDSSGSLLAYGSDNGDISIWNIPSGRHLQTIPVEGRAYIPAVIFNGNHQVSAVVKPRSYRSKHVLLNTYSLTNSQLTRSIKFQGTVQDSFTFDATGEKLAWIRNDVTEIVDVVNGEPTHQFKVDDYALHYTFSPIQQLLAVGGAKSVTVWDVSKETANVENP